MKALTLLILTLSTGVAFAGAETKTAAEKPAPAAIDPSFKKTVDAFNGTWSCENTVLMPGAKEPSKVKEMLVCKTTAMGKGVVCSDSVKNVPGIGPIEGTFLFGYDLATKAVHMFAVNSVDDVHDHKCFWKDDKRLECEPLKGSMGVEPITEEISIGWSSATTIAWKTAIIMKDGSRISIDTSCKRGK